MATLGANALIGSYGLSWAGTQGTGAAAGTVIGGGFGAMSLGVGLLVVGGLVDGKIISGLFGKGRGQWQPPRLVGLPVQSGEPGHPRVWAIGRRVRVPVHCMWQDEKRISVRSSSGMKATPGARMQRVLVDCALALNDRETRQLTQLVGQGKLILWTERSIVSVRTSGMTLAEVAGEIVFTMGDTAEPSFADRFEVDDIVTLRGFVTVSGPSINYTGYWRVTAVAGHTSTPSTLTIAPYTGQSIAGLNSTAGTPAAPAEIIRADSSVASHTCSFLSDPITAEPRTLRITPSYGTPPDDVFQGGDRVVLSGFGGGAAVLNGLQLTVQGATATYLDIDVQAIYSGGGAVVGPSAGTSTNAAIVRFWATSYFSTGLFPSGFVPSQHYYAGTLTQDPDATIEAEEGAGQVSAYRGVAYQVLVDFDVTAFGGQLPPQLEALIDPDSSMTWAGAFSELCARHGIPTQFVDTGGVIDEPFEGMFTRGAMAGATVLQPLLLAKQVATQDRDGALCFFAIDNADAVQVENGATFSDLIPSNGSDDKITFEDQSPEDLPTSVAIRHQDPDNYYADGYQVHGLRNPSATGEENRQEVDLSNVVLTRRQAADLATTLMRRAYVNSRQVRMQLSAAYLHVLENDLLTVTDDDGNDHTVRVIRRDVGSNYAVQVTGVVEDVDLAVTGSPTQGSAGVTTPPPVQLAPIVGRVLDMPPLTDPEGLSPGLVVAACAQQGGTWAGCGVYRSINGGTDWTQVGTLSQQCGLGITEDTLAAAAPSETLGTSALTWDATGTVTVEFDNVGQMPLATTTEASVQQGVNWLLLDSGGGDIEIIAARDVVQNTATNYTFSYLLRGLRGTIAGCAAARPAGARVTVVSFLTSLGGLFIDSAGQETSVVQDFRFVPPGADVTDQTSVGITATWRNCSPFPVRGVTKTINGTTSVRFEVDHWTRAALPPGSTGPYAMDETYEEYRFDLWNASRTAIVYRKTITARNTGSSVIRDKWVEFTQAETDAAAAGYTLGPGETFWLDVVQVGDFGESPSNVQEL